MPALKTKVAISCGGIVYRPTDGGFEVALITLDDSRVWQLPKGLVEKGESLEATARREVGEETGLTGRIVAKLGQIDYWFYWKSEGVRYHKFVHFFLLEHTGGDTSKHDWEVESVEWLPIDDAIGKLTYDSEREMMAKAKQILSGSEGGNEHHQGLST